MNKKLLVLAIALTPVLAYSAPQITFQGEVTTQTCVAEVNGQTEGIVLLPTVPTLELTNVNDKTGLTPFTISVKDCPAPGTDININTNFLGHNVTNSGNLGNLDTSPIGASNVQLQLLDKYTGGTAITLTGTTPVAGIVLKKDATTASHQFGVQYITEEGGATAGKVLSIAEYSVSYN